MSRIIKAFNTPNYLMTALDGVIIALIVTLIVVGIGVIIYFIYERVIK